MTIKKGAKREEKLIGYKMTKTDGTSFYDHKLKYEVGAILKIDNPDENTQPCGRGLHLAVQPHGPMKYNAVWPWRLWKCEYEIKDLLGGDDTKVRVRSLKVIEELDPKAIGLPRAPQLFDRLERLQKYTGMKAQTKLRKQNIIKALRVYVKRLNAHPAARGRTVVLKKIEFHGIEEWGSVWDSVQDSVQDSVWDSVWGSVWGSVWDSVRGSVCLDDDKNPFLLEHDVLDYGAVLYGVDKKGIAHVIMPTSKEVATKGDRP
jgi:hypothetical protein